MNDTTVTVVSEPFSGELLVEECHEHFIEDVFGKPNCHENTTSEKTGVPTTAQRMFLLTKKIMIESDHSIFVGYGYGFLAVFIISILSLGGLLAFPFIYKVSFQYVLATFTALAVGTLFGDAMFHLIPIVRIKKSNQQIVYEDICFLL